MFSDKRMNSDKVIITEKDTLLLQETSLAEVAILLTYPKF